MRRLEFLGNTFTRDNVLRREIIVNEGDIYNQSHFEYSVLRLNQLGYFEPIDEEQGCGLSHQRRGGLVDINLKVRSAVASRFPLTAASLASAARSSVSSIRPTIFWDAAKRSRSIWLHGNRQRSFQFSFTEPYFRDRPITVGFSLFAFYAKVFR